MTSVHDSAPSPESTEIRFLAPGPLVAKARQEAAAYDSLSSFMRHILREWFKEHRG